MAFPNKKSRKITIDNHNYLWIARGRVGNNECIDLSIMSAEINGQKLFAQYNYNTVDINSDKFKTPFIISPFIVRKTIVHGLKNGYKPKQKERDLNLGNLSNVFDINVSGQESTRQLIQKIENLSLEQFVNSRKQEKDILHRENIQNIISVAKTNITKGQWFVVFERLLESLHSAELTINSEIISLIKLIFENETVHWEIDYSWIETFKIVEELYPKATGVFKNH